MNKPIEDPICVESVRLIMDIFGGKWAFLIMGALHNGPVRFNELRRTLGINTKSQTDVLRNLEANEIITRTVIPTVPVTVEYALTEKGRDFEKVFYEMREWGKKWLKPD